jgi:hypothetical protein
MVIKYTNIFNCKALQNIPKLGILGIKKYHLATLILSLCQARFYCRNVILCAAVTLCFYYGSASLRALKCSNDSAECKQGDQMGLFFILPSYRVIVNFG